MIKTSCPTEKVSEESTHENHTMGQRRKWFRMRFLTKLVNFKFWAKSALSWPLLQKLKPASFGTDSGKVNATKFVENFDRSSEY
jgi:hypothetical protein